MHAAYVAGILDGEGCLTVGLNKKARTCDARVYVGMTIKALAILQSLNQEFGGTLRVESRAFPLRPVPDPSVKFKGTPREAGWRRCGQMSEPDGIRFTPWPHEEYPSWSVPALEAAKCVAKQGDEAFDRLHLRLYEAFFTESRNIADPAEVQRIVAAAGADMDRFAADYAAGLGREALIGDFEAARAQHAEQVIPTVIVVETGRTLVGLADVATYRAAIEEARA